MSRTAYLEIERNDENLPVIVHGVITCDWRRPGDPPAEPYVTQIWAELEATGEAIDLTGDERLKAEERLLA